MRKIISNVASLFLVVILVAGGIGYLSSLTERKESQNKFEDFYKDATEYEVLFVGASHVLNGIFPMELWEEYGITSYNLAGHGNRMAMNYWVLRNALEYADPKLVVLDTFMIGREDKIASLEQLHISTDHIPYSSLKVEMIEDLVEEEERRKDFLFKFSTYHHRWNELSAEDFQGGRNVEKGAESRINVAKVQENLAIEESDVLEEKTINMEYLDRIVSLCEEKEIQLLLTYLPFPDPAGWRKESHTMEEIAKEYGVQFLDYDTLNSVITPQTDFYDEDSHLNPSGAKKITSYLGDYIRKNYGLEDHREQEEYEQWHEAYKEYYEYKLSLIEQEEELKNTLMLLNDANVSYGIYFKPWNTITQYPVLLNLLENMGIDFSQIPNEDYFYVKDALGNKEHVLKLFETIDTDFGEFSLFYNEDGHLELTSSKTDSMIITLSDIAVVVFHPYNLSTVTQKRFTFSEADLEFVEIKE